MALLTWHRLQLLRTTKKMKRRAFIRSTVLGVPSGGPRIRRNRVGPSCSPALPTFKTTFKGDQIAVPLSSFAESNLLIVRDMQVEYDMSAGKKSRQQNIQPCDLYEVLAPRQSL